MLRPLATLCLLLIPLCLPGQTPAADLVIVVPDTDPRMRAAIDSARASAPRFMRILTAPSPRNVLLTIKVPLSDGRSTEHVWISDLRVRADSIEGTIDNDVKSVSGFARGQLVRVPTDSLSDWMAITGGRVLGGFSLRALREGMSPDERQRFDLETHGVFSGPTLVE